MDDKPVMIRWMHIQVSASFGTNFGPQNHSSFRGFLWGYPQIIHFHSSKGTIQLFGVPPF